MGNKKLYSPTTSKFWPQGWGVHNPFLFLILRPCKCLGAAALAPKSRQHMSGHMKRNQFACATTLGIRPPTHDPTRGHFCGLLLRHATKLLWGLVNLRTLRTSTEKKSQIIALNGATPVAAKRENRLSSRKSPTTPFRWPPFHITLWWLFLSPRHAIFSWCRRLLLKWLTMRRGNGNAAETCVCAGKCECESAVPRQTFAVSMCLCKRRRSANDCS